MKRLQKLSKIPRTSGLLAGCLAGLALPATASAASAVTYRPTRTDDPAPNGCKPKDCSLREAVIAANATPITVPVTIDLRPGRTYKLTRPGRGEDAALTGDLDLSRGAVVVKTKGRRAANRAVIDGNGLDRILDLHEGSVTLKRVVLRDGHARTDAGDDGDGGGIRGGLAVDVELDGSRLIGNLADGSGGAVFGRDRVWVFGSLLKRNSAAGDGGAVDVAGSGSGEPTAITDSRATHNRAGGNGGMASVTMVGIGVRDSYVAANRASGDGGAIFSPGGVGLIGSTVAGNASGGNGGGLAGPTGLRRSTISGNFATSSGGGVYTLPAPGNIVPYPWGNSTIADNRAHGNGGGVAGSGGGTRIQLNAVTVARNLANSDSAGGGQGGGIFQGPGDAIAVRNTIVALNLLGAGSVGRDCFNASTGFISLGHDLIGDAHGCAGFIAAGDLIGGALKLGKLADNGGRTKTIALMRDSRAIDAADSAAPHHDQRGVKRGRKPDIGAYERRAKK